MPRGANAQLAADMYLTLLTQKNWPPAEAWKGIAELLLTCEIQKDSVWMPFVPKGGSAALSAVVYRETNDFKFRHGKPSQVIQRAQKLSAHLATELGCSPADLCSQIGAYWRNATIRPLQYHNLVGHSFRSIVVEILRHYGAAGISYTEEEDAAQLFKGWPLKSRSEIPKIDILAYKGALPVAMLSTRWRFRHDRVDMIDEAHSYSAAAARMYGGFPYYAVTGEFNPSRLKKVLDNVPSPVAAAVHFCPELIVKGLGENGRTATLKGLEWLIQETHRW